MKTDLKTKCLPLGRGDDLLDHASIVALRPPSFDHEVGVSVAGRALE